MLAQILSLLAKAAAEGGAAMAQQAGGNLGKMASGTVLEDTGLTNAKSITAALRGAMGQADAGLGKDTDKAIQRILDRSGRSIQRVLEKSGQAGMGAAAGGRPNPYGSAAKFAAGDWRQSDPFRDPFSYGTAPTKDPQKSLEAFQAGKWGSPQQERGRAFRESHPFIAAATDLFKKQRDLLPKGGAFGGGVPGKAAVFAMENPLGAAAGLATGLIASVKAIEAFNRTMIESQRDLGKWNGSIAKSTARYDVAQIQLAQITARETSRSYDKLTRSQIELERNLQPIESAWQNFKNYMGVAFNKTASALLAPGYFGVSDAAKAILGDARGTLNQADQFLKSMFDEATNQTAIKNAKSPIIGPRPRKP